MKRLFTVSFLQHQGVCNEEALSHLYCMPVLTTEWVVGQVSLTVIMDKLDIRVPLFIIPLFHSLPPPWLSFVSYTHRRLLNLFFIRFLAQKCWVWSPPVLSRPRGAILGNYISLTFEPHPASHWNLKKLLCNPSCHCSLLFLWYSSPSLNSRFNSLPLDTSHF